MGQLNSMWGVARSVVDVREVIGLGCLVRKRPSRDEIIKGKDKAGVQKPGKTMDCLVWR